MEHHSTITETKEGYDGDFVVEGYLKKQKSDNSGSVYGDLTKRWFRLDLKKRVFSYSASRRSDKPLFSIPFTDIVGCYEKARVDTLPANLGTWSFGFEVMTRERTYFLYAMSQESRIVWVKAFNAVVHGDTTFTPSTLGVPLGHEGYGTYGHHYPNQGFNEYVTHEEEIINPEPILLSREAHIEDRVVGETVETIMAPQPTGYTLGVVDPDVPRGIEKRLARKKVGGRASKKIRDDTLITDQGIFRTGHPEENGAISHALGTSHTMTNTGPMTEGGYINDPRRATMGHRGTYPKGRPYYEPELVTGMENMGIHDTRYREGYNPDRYEYYRGNQRVIPHHAGYPVGYSDREYTPREHGYTRGHGYPTGHNYPREHGYYPREQMLYPGERYEEYDPYYEHQMMERPIPTHDVLTVGKPHIFRSDRGTLDRTGGPINFDPTIRHGVAKSNGYNVGGVNDNMVGRVIDQVKVPGFREGNTLYTPGHTLPNNVTIPASMINLGPQQPNIEKTTIYKEPMLVEKERVLVTEPVLVEKDRRVVQETMPRTHGFDKRLLHNEMRSPVMRQGFVTGPMMNRESHHGTHTTTLPTSSYMVGTNSPYATNVPTTGHHNRRDFHQGARQHSRSESNDSSCSSCSECSKDTPKHILSQRNSIKKDMTHTQGQTQGHTNKVIV